jgi:hypothetical protein
MMTLSMKMTTTTTMTTTCAMTELAMMMLVGVHARVVSPSWNKDQAKT